MITISWFTAMNSEVMWSVNSRSVHKHSLKLTKRSKRILKLVCMQNIKWPWPRLPYFRDLTISFLNHAKKIYSSCFQDLVKYISLAIEHQILSEISTLTKLYPIAQSFMTVLNLYNNKRITWLIIFLPNKKCKWSISEVQKIIIKACFCLVSCNIFDIEYNNCHNWISKLCWKITNNQKVIPFCTKKANREPRKHIYPKQIR